MSKQVKCTQAHLQIAMKDVAEGKGVRASARNHGECYFSQCYSPKIFNFSSHLLI